MIYPKIFELVKNDPQVQLYLGTNPVRFFPFGYAPQDTKLTYAVWQTVSGTPANTLKCAPKGDDWSIQVDVYGSSVQDVRKAANALILKIQDTYWVTSIRGESRDFETKLFRYSFDVQLLQLR